MAVFVYYREELLGRYDSPTKEILDKLIKKSQEKIFLVRYFADEADLPKLVSDSQRVINTANVLLGFNRDYMPSPLRGSDPDRMLGTIKIGEDHFKYQPFAHRPFLTEENIDTYFSSPINVFTNENFQDIMVQYAKGGLKCMLPDGWTTDCDQKRKYRIVPSYALLMQAGIKIKNGEEK
jgi:hypothetical protein